MLVVGPTGAGKSVLLALIALQFRRYAGAQLYIFDKGWSARAAVLAMGGAHHSLGLAAEGSGELSFQPLRDIYAADECTWAPEWIATLIAHDGVTITPDIQEHTWSPRANHHTAAPGESPYTGR